MLRRFALSIVVLAACAATTSMSAVAHAEYRPIMALTPAHGPVPPMKNAAIIEMTEGGFRYIAGQQNSHLTMSMAEGKLRFVDTGTRELRDIPQNCSRKSVGNGIAALCSIPTKFEDGRMYLEVWPRLGNDFIDGSALPAQFRLWALADAGDDTVLGGNGDDFMNGAQDDDKVWGGAGNDWLRTGLGNDELRGGAGDDKLVGVYDDDVIRGGDGNDRVGGGPGNDVLRADGGQDQVLCGNGRDSAYIDKSDRTSQCESLARY